MSTEKTENLDGRMRLAGMCRRFSVFARGLVHWYESMADSITVFCLFVEIRPVRQGTAYHFSDFRDGGNILGVRMIDLIAFRTN